MNSRNFRLGDILLSTHIELRNGYHPIIYIEAKPYSRNEFIGAMITRSDINGNIALSDAHFFDNDEEGNKYQIIFKNNYLVPAKLIKFEDWGPFRKQGQLTKEGIDFLQKTIGTLHEETFANYYRRTKV